MIAEVLGMRGAGVAADRRTADRAHIEVDVSLDSDSHFFAGLTGDVSAGGVFVATYRALRVGDEVHLRFSLPFGEVSARGRVRWLRNASIEHAPGAGVAFDELAPDAKEAIERFCRARPPLFYDLENDGDPANAIL
jgi:uncharacterized protein (TIGR02266 family)